MEAGVVTGWRRQGTTRTLHPARSASRRRHRVYSRGSGVRGQGLELRGRCNVDTVTTTAPFCYNHRTDYLTFPITWSVVPKVLAEQCCLESERNVGNRGRFLRVVEPAPPTDTAVKLQKVVLRHF